MGTLGGGRENICGERIRYIRRLERRWTLEDLSAVLEIDYGIHLGRTVLTKIEQGRRRIADYELVAIAAPLEVRIEDLFIGSGSTSLENFVKGRKGKKMSPESIKKQSARQRILDYFIAHQGEVVNKEDLMAVAQISDWPRRVRELRDKYGWRISSFNDRADLKPGQYVLESMEQRPPSPHHITSDQRTRILYRDGHTCQTCGLSVGETNPDNPTRKIRLHVVHFTPTSAGGDNSDNNLLAICDICNQGRPNLFNPDDDNMSALTFIREKPKAVQLQIYDWLKNKFGDQSG